MAASRGFPSGQEGPPEWHGTWGGLSGKERTALKRQTSRATGTKFGRPRKVDDSEHIAHRKADEAPRRSVVGAWSANPQHALIPDGARWHYMASSDALRAPNQELLQALLKPVSQDGILPAALTFCMTSADA